MEHTPPQVIKVKRRYNEEPLPSLIVESSRKKAKLPSGEYVFRLSRTESGGLGGNDVVGNTLGAGGIVGGSGVVVGAPPVVRSTLPMISTTTTAPATTSAAVPVPGASGSVGVGVKRKGVPESPLGVVGGVVGGDVPIGAATSLTSTGAAPAGVSGAPPTHGHPPGGKDNAAALQIPQPRKFHLAHRMGYNKAARKDGAAALSGGAAGPKKSAVFMEGDGGLPLKSVGGSVGGGTTTREKKRRRKRKDEVRTRLSKESLRGLAMTAAAAAAADTSTTATSSAHTAGGASTRKRPKVHPREKMELEARRRKASEGETKKADGEPVIVVTDAKSPQAQPLSSSASARGKNAHRHPEVPDASASTPAKDNVDNDDDELSRQLQQMVLDYLSVQDGIVNLPTEQSVRKRPSRVRADKIGGGVGGGTWEKVDRKEKDKSEDEGATATEDETEEDEEEEEEEEGWVYDVYVREKIPEIKKIVTAEGETVADGATPAATAAERPGVKPGEYGVLVITDPDDEEWFYRGAWDDEASDGEHVLSDDEDSNAEDYHTNDYPDEEEFDDEFIASAEGYLFGDDEEDADYDPAFNPKHKPKAASGHIDSVAPSYLRDLGFEDEDDDDEGNDEEDSDAVNDDDDDVSDSYENIYGGSRRKMASGSGGSGYRRRYPPGEEEYDLDEESSEDEEDTDDGVGASELTRLRLQKGVWGYDKPLAVAGGKLAVAPKNLKGKVVRSDDVDSDEDMH